MYVEHFWDRPSTSWYFQLLFYACYSALQKISRILTNRVICSRKKFLQGTLKFYKDLMINAFQSNLFVCFFRWLRCAGRLERFQDPRRKRVRAFGPRPAFHVSAVNRLLKVTTLHLILLIKIPWIKGAQWHSV